MRRLYPLTLVVLAVGLSFARAADADADDKAIRDLAERYYAAYAAKDLDAFMGLWSEKSPDYEATRKFMAGLYREAGPMEVKSLRVIWVRADGDAASVRVRVVMAVADPQAVQPRPSLVRLNVVLGLAREAGSWKVARYGPPDRWLITRLADTPSKADRLRLLNDDSDLIGSGLVLRVLQVGREQARRGRFAAASRLQDLAFEIATGMGDTDVLAWCHLDRGLSLALRSRYESALASDQMALALFREANDRVGEGSALNNIGNAYKATGHYTEALQQFQGSLKIKRDLGSRAAEAGTLNNIGLIYYDTGRYAEALKELQDSLKITRDLKDAAGEAQALDGIGTVYGGMGRYAEALQQFQDSLTIQRDQNDRAGEALTLHNIGTIYFAAGRYADALQQYQDSLKIQRDLDDRAKVATTLNNIGLVYKNTHRYPEALQQFQASLGIQRELKDRAGEAQALSSIGGVYGDTKDYADARRQFEAALAIAESIGDLAAVESCQANLGRTYQVRKQWREAVRAYREAIRVTEQLRANTREPSLQTSLLEQKTEPFFLLAVSLQELREPAQAFAAGEQMKARGLVDILAQGKADLHRGMTDDERKQEQSFQDRLTALAIQVEDLRSRKAGADRQAELADDLVKARLDYEAFRRDLYLHRPELQDRRAEFAPASLDDLGRSAFAGRPGLAVLSYLVGDDETLLFVLTPGERDGGAASLTVHRIDVGEKDVADAVDAFRAACADPAAAAPDSADLYRWLIAPAADELAVAKQVVVVPHGVLQNLPFQTLQDPDGKYLIERFPLSYAPSVTALVKMEDLGERRRKQYAGKPPSLLAVGVSDFGRREKPLPAAEKESRALAEVFGDAAKLLAGAEATRARVEASWSGRRYLHFATHGRLNPDFPLYSSLVLSPANANDDGVLYAQDLVNADVPAELAVMSACETGLGRRVDGEGLMGLSWSWFAAGVPSTVASQWSVGDASTARLMKTFYGRLKAGDSKTESLRQAELALLKDDATRHPFYWAPFVLVGDDR